MCKSFDTTCFDLTKAFDRVTEERILKKLISLLDCNLAVKTEFRSQYGMVTTDQSWVETGRLSYLESFRNW